MRTRDLDKGHALLLMAYINETTDYNAYFTLSDNICLRSTWYDDVRYFKTSPAFHNFIYKKKIVDNDEFQEWLSNNEVVKRFANGC